MLPPRELRNRRKLLISSISLAAVLLIAGVAQRSHRPADPFSPEGTRTRTERAAPAAAEERRVFGSGTSRPDPLSADPLPRETPVAQDGPATAPQPAARRDGVPA